MEQIMEFLHLEGFGTAFSAAMGMIIATELGDRTFFIAAIMAMQYPRLIILGGALSALVLMTVISAVFGMAAIALLPQVYVQFAVVGLMLFFGGNLLLKAYRLPSNQGFEEMDEVEEEMKEKKDKKDEEEMEAGQSNSMSTSKAGGSASLKSKGPNMKAIALEAFTLTFFAEWGDRSQLATIALAAVDNPIGVILGGIVGHLLCTGFAVVAGKMIANYVSVKSVTYFGGALFLIFGLMAMNDAIKLL